jgi:hypothetical protein
VEVAATSVASNAVGPLHTHVSCRCPSASARWLLDGFFKKSPRLGDVIVRFRARKMVQDSLVGDRGTREA